jgi:hypothetical protein
LRATRTVHIAVAISVTCALGCGAASQHPADSGTQHSTALSRYVTQIEPLRLAVNRLLMRADPILSAFRTRRLGASAACRRMGALEWRFAEYAVAVNAIRPETPALRALQAKYAATYALEDAYLSALVAGLRRHDLSNLPRTEAAQRAAVIEWRIGLMVLAQQAGTTLPPDLQQAGRGEIAPSPEGS